MKAAIDLVRRLGVIDAVLMVAARSLEFLSRGRAQLVKYYFLAQPVPRATNRPVARAGGIAVAEVFADDPRLVQFERPMDELARRFANSSRCFAAWHGETLAGFLWFTEHRYEEDEVRCTFRIHPLDRAVWDFDVHIVPRFRLGRTFALLWESAFAAMRERDVRWSISRVSAFKAESIRAHQRLGARCTGSAVFLLLGSLQFTFTSPGRLKCRRLEQGPYPSMDVQAPGEPIASGKTQQQLDKRPATDSAGPAS
jgi:hypothetical protein